MSSALINTLKLLFSELLDNKTILKRVIDNSNYTNIWEHFLL